uniref:Uncharacterized protein n=1 Tax=Prymnesium polylepis TaxID=72548 RepID=A0A6V4UYE4_9EUKA
MPDRGKQFTIDVTPGDAPQAPPTPPQGISGRRGSNAISRRGGPGAKQASNNSSKERELTALEAFGRQAAAVLGDPELATAKEATIRKRAKERIEAIKVELQTGVIGPMALDKQFAPVWALAHAAIVERPAEVPLD